MQRAVTAWHLGWEGAHAASGREWQAPLLAQLLDDPYSQVRFVSGRSLRSLPGFEDLDYDFLASSESRRRTKHQVVEKWKESGCRPDPVPAARMIVGQDGRPDHDLIQQLLRQRDLTPVAIPE